MVKTLSQMIPLGSAVPDFSLPNVYNDQLISSQSLKPEKGLIVAFLCNHCPFVKHIEDKLVEVAQDVIKGGIETIAISSNDVENYPEDSPEKMKLRPYTFPYLFDETQDVAKAFKAECTPDFFLFNKDLMLVYRGRFCPSTPGNGEAVTGADLLAACKSVIEGVPPTTEQFPSVGCSIKWRM